MLLKNTTEGIHPYQRALWDKVSAGGFKHGEMMLISAGRQTGKSMVMKIMKNRMYGTMNKPQFSKEASAIVDGEQWYTVRVNDKDMAAWIRTQSKQLMYDHTITSGPLFSLFDVHEKIYIMMGMKQS